MSQSQYSLYSAQSRSDESGGVRWGALLLSLAVVCALTYAGLRYSGVKWGGVATLAGALSSQLRPDVPSMAPQAANDGERIAALETAVAELKSDREAIQININELGYQLRKMNGAAGPTQAGPVATATITPTVEPTVTVMPTETLTATKNAEVGKAIEISDFDYKFLAIRGDVYDEYSYKATITNTTNKTLQVLVTFTFFDKSNFELQDGDTQTLTLSPGESYQLSSRAIVSYPAADDVDHVGIYVECFGRC